MTTMPAVVWTELAVSDLEKSVAYYQTVLNRPAHVSDMAATTTYVFGDNSVTGFQLIPAENHVANQSVIHVMVAGSVESAVERTQQNGGSLEGDILTMPFGKIAYTRDIDGNRVGLFEPAA